MVVNLISYSNSTLKRYCLLCGTTSCSFLNISTHVILILLLHLIIAYRMAYCRRCRRGLCLGRVVRTELSPLTTDSALSSLGKLSLAQDNPLQKLITPAVHSVGHLGCQALLNSLWRVLSTLYLCVYKRSYNEMLLLTKNLHLWEVDDVYQHLCLSHLEGVRMDLPSTNLNLLIQNRLHKHPWIMNLLDCLQS